MPQLYVLGDESHTVYKIVSSQVAITAVSGKWQTVKSDIQCSTSNCVVLMNNLCNIDNTKHEINWINMQTSIGEVEYLVNCDPNSFYKPF